MSYEHNGDRIVYALYDKDDTLVGAHFDKGDALAQINRAKTKLALEPKVIDVSVRRKAILAAMDPIDRLIMDPPKPDTNRRGQ